MSFAKRVLVLLSVFLSALSFSVQAASSTIVISQIYSGLGIDTDPRPSHIYIELFNRGTTTVALDSWTLQFSTDGTTVWQALPLSGSLAPGQYYLVRSGSAISGGSLPRPDLTTSITFGQAVGKLALLSDATTTSAGCIQDVTSLVDLVGYGTTTCRESRPITASSAFRSYMRKGGGCTDTDDNFADFEAVSPLPRNTASSRNVCATSTGSDTRTFSVPNRSGTSFQSTGAGGSQTIGYARVQPGQGSTSPAGVAIFGLRQGGVLVSEAGVPASRLMTTGVTYAEIQGPVNTGIAIANPNNQPVTIDYVVTDVNTVQSDTRGSVVIPANSQFAKFLNEAPFGLSVSLSGTFSFTASDPVGVIALRGFTNERGEFLMTTLPVIDTSTAPSSDVTYLPHFAVNGGWRTEIILVNRNDITINGTVAFLQPNGSPATVPIGTITASTAEYSIPQQRALKFTLPDTGGTLQVGSVRITPRTGDRAPVALGVFADIVDRVRVSEAGVSGVRGTQFRMYVEESGSPDAVGSIQTGFAIMNTAAADTSVQVELLRLDGTSTGLTTNLTIVSGGQIARFPNQIFPLLARPFQGIMRLTASNAVAMAVIRGRYNERGHFVMTTLPVTDELQAAFSGETIFPHIVDGGGFTTQFILFSGSTDQAASGTVLFRTIGGQALPLEVR